MRMCARGFSLVVCAPNTGTFSSPFAGGAHQSATESLSRIRCSLAQLSLTTANAAQSAKYSRGTGAREDSSMFLAFHDIGKLAIKVGMKEWLLSLFLV